MSKYSKEFKEEAIRLSDEIGNKKAAAQLGLPYYTLADWRNKSKHKPKEPELSNTELKIRNRELERENAELRGKIQHYEDVIQRNNLWHFFRPRREKAAMRDDAR